LACKFKIIQRALSGGFVLAAALLILTSCNKLRLGYEYADWFVIYSVEDNFDLEKVQRNSLKEDVAAYFRWHRKKMLPNYADFLTWTADHAKDGIHMRMVDSGYVQYQILQRNTVLPAIDKAQDLLTSLTPDQIEAWVTRQAKKNLKMRKDFSGGLEERLEIRYGKIIEELEDWTGPLSVQQKASIKALNKTLPWNGLLWLDAREKAQLCLTELLRKGQTGQELRLFLEDYYFHPEKFWSKEYRLEFKRFETRMRTMIVVIHNQLTSAQKLHFLAQVEKLAKDFRILSLKD
jgi:hypothetical protein